MKSYETTFILESEVLEEDLEKIIERYKAFIEEQDVNVIKIDNWGKRKLAYEINNNTYGYYIYIRFDGPEDTIAKLERHYKLDEQVIRYLTIHLDNKALQTEKAALEESEAA